jgi:hypothetical protein
MGTIGKTHGVSRDRAPTLIASHRNDHSDLPPTGSDLEPVVAD